MSCPSRIDHRLAIVLFATDAGFVFLHLVGEAGWMFQNPLLSLHHDGGFSEWFQYTKEFWAFVLLGILAVRKRSAMLFALSLLFLYLLLDDSRQVHEKLGLALASRGVLQPHFGLMARHLGELVVSAVVGAIFLVPIGLGYLRSDGDTRRIGRWVLGLTVLLALTAGVIDAMNTLVKIPGGELIEEIGELLVMSAIVTFVFGLVPARLAWTSGEPSAH